MASRSRATIPRVALTLFACATLLGAEAPAQVAGSDRRVAQWNAFADALLEVHRKRSLPAAATSGERLGGYAGRPGFYHEVNQRDEHGHLLARVQWERTAPDRLHAIELFFRDDRGRLLRHYSASYLPDHRNAPLQTLIGLHAYPGELSAFRQFDASGELLYEQCRGRFGEERVNLALESWDLPYAPGNGGNDASAAAYAACFSALPASAADYLDPRDELARSELAELDRRIAVAPDDAQLRLARGEVHLARGDHAAALAEFDRAIALDADLDAAWFGRGMARGRLGQLDAGIADLTVFLERNPRSSLGYTKRGIRHFWNDDMASAERDLSRAIELDAGNAEARDDLGVILARRGEHAAAMAQFRETIRLQPGYRKAHHNLALVLHLDGQDAAALDAVDNALALDPGARASLLLKAAVLRTLGQVEEADTLAALADGLPEDDWSERAEVR